MWKIASGKLLDRELISGLCDDQEQWGGGVGGRLKTEGIVAYLKVIHLVEQQKRMQHFKAIIL